MNRRFRLVPIGVSIMYVAMVFGMPMLARPAECPDEWWKVFCQAFPSVPMTGFDQWGSYISGALVPLSLIWVAMAFRLQQLQLGEQAAQQAENARTALEGQRIADRQALAALAPTYVQRMESALKDLADLINSALPADEDAVLYGRVDGNGMDEVSYAATVFTKTHNLLISMDSGEVDGEYGNWIKNLFVDSDMSDYLGFFLDIYSEFKLRCTELECLVLLPPSIQSCANSLRWNVLRSSWRWHHDDNERKRLIRLAGWDEAQLAKHLLERPDDNIWQPHRTQDS